MHRTKITLLSFALLLCGFTGCQTNPDSQTDQNMQIEEKSSEVQTVDNQIIIGFANDASDETIKTILRSIDGVTVKQIGSLNSYLVQLPNEQSVANALVTLSSESNVIYSEKNTVKSKH